MLIFEIFHTELSKFPRGGLDHTYKTSFNFRHIGFKIRATVIVPVYIEFTGQTRQETVTSLLMNDSRNGQPKTWILKKKNKQRGATPRCRGCRNEQQDGELCISVVGLYRHLKIDVYVKPLAKFWILQLYYNSFYTSFEIC